MKYGILWHPLAPSPDLAYLVLSSTTICTRSIYTYISLSTLLLVGPQLIHLLGEVPIQPQVHLNGIVSCY